MRSNHRVVDEAVRRFVSVQAVNPKAKHHDGDATGFIIRTGLVMTCEHVLGRDTAVTVNHKPAKILDDDPVADLMLIQTETPEMEPLAFSDEYELMDQVFWYGGDFAGKGPVAIEGVISQHTDKCILISAHAIHGCSGSLLWKFNSKHPIGVVFEREKDSKIVLGSAIPASAVKIYLRQAYRRLSFIGNLWLPFPAA